MNQHLMNAIEHTARADAVMHAMDETVMQDAEDNLQWLFLTAWDSVKTIAAELELLAADKRVVDAIYAANKARNDAANCSE